MPFATANGIRLYYEWHGVEHGTPVVLAWGSEATARGGRSSWRRWRRTAASSCSTIAAPGGATRPTSACTSRSMAEDLLGLLDALGVERAHLVGLSLGGTIAQEAALGAPARIASLQLHATWAGPHPYFEALVGAVRTVRLQLDRESFYRALSVWLFTPQCFATSPSWSRSVVQRAAHQAHPMAIDAYLRQTDAGLGHDARDRVHLIRCPTLVAVGSQDLITPPLLAEELASRIPGARLSGLAGRRARRDLGGARGRQPLCLEFLDGVGRWPGAGGRERPGLTLVTPAEN